MSRHMSRYISISCSVFFLWLQLVVVCLTVVHFVHLPYIYGGLDKLGVLPAKNIWIPHALFKTAVARLRIADCYYLMSLMIFSLLGLAFSFLPRECDAELVPADCPISVPPHPPPTYVICYIHMQLSALFTNICNLSLLYVIVYKLIIQDYMLYT